MLWCNVLIFPKHFTDFARYLQTIFNYNGSVNFYMFHGGSSFGFLNGANVFDFFPNFMPDVSSYGKHENLINGLQHNKIKLIAGTAWLLAYLYVE